MSDVKTKQRTKKLREKNKERIKNRLQKYYDKRDGIIRRSQHSETSTIIWLLSLILIMLSSLVLNL